MKNKDLQVLSASFKIANTYSYWLKKIESLSKANKQKQIQIERTIRLREMNLDLYLVEKNRYDGSVKSNFQRLLEGTKDPKFNRFFEESDLEGNQQ